eukprot:CAMPEP_0202699076 /NCGR_PEP_ID=MMETSP1385-20130828/12299_1 /ASSEMBLY_ACC=CAM_ASM_000861 /TAXON_ID=933848 /ORGANISM="Elphidium margaritaceum" /LENGTH=59 /DNA_ID=CAMNT_0049355931 /DNA_START=227 /DNA_END=406 /DNA_ORIENTATION=-
MDKETKHSYPQPTFPSQPTIVGKKRTLLSTVKKSENEQQQQQQRNENNHDNNDRNAQGY